MSVDRVPDGRNARLAEGRTAGSAEQLLAAGVSLLAPEETVLEAMLAGWVTQQRARMLAGHTIEQRQLLVRRFARFSGDYPWQWTASDVEDWTAHLVGAGLAHATVRNYQTSVALFCGYIVDPRYRWVQVCEQHFGQHPIQVFHEWNTVVHRSEYEGRPGNRALTRDELQAFFDHCDTRDDVGLPDRRAGERATGVHPASVITLVRRGGAVVDVGPAITVRPAAPQLGIEGIKDVRSQLAHLHRAHQGNDVPVDDAAVSHQRLRLDLQQIEVAREQLRNGGRGARVPLLVHFDEPSAATPSRPARRRQARRG